MPYIPSDNVSRLSDAISEIESYLDKLSDIAADLDNAYTEILDRYNEICKYRDELQEE